MLKSTAIKDNRDWLYALEHCTETWSYDDVEVKARETIARMIDAAKGHRRVAYGWCAGKDSVVLQHLMERSGIEATPIMWRGLHEWPEMVAWIDENAPNGLRSVPVDKFTFQYLNNHPDLLFCKNGTRTEWMKEKWKVMRRTMKDYDILITGRRIMDGNVCGKNGVVCGAYRTYSPIFDWSNDLLLAYIKHHDIRLPPLYSYPNGFLTGSVSTGEWTEYPALGRTDGQVLDVIWRIDSSVIEDATELDAVRHYLEKRR